MRNTDRERERQRQTETEGEHINTHARGGDDTTCTNFGDRTHREMCERKTGRVKETGTVNTNKCKNTIVNTNEQNTKHKQKLYFTLRNYFS